MTQQDALVRAVCEHPDEDTPRLIFADHLEECGDARRAAFIRTQVRLALLPEYDPFHAECRRRDPDAFRGWTMAHTLPRLPDGASWRRFQFRRGFPWLASVTDCAALLRNSERLFSSTPIQALELNHDCGVTQYWDAFVEWPLLAKLTRLEFSHTRLNATQIRKLSRSPYSVNLRELAFEGDAIAANGLLALAESPLFPRLRRLELRQAGLAPALAMDGLAAAPPGLRELVLADCKFPGTDVAWLLNSPLAASLVSLDLGFNPIRAAGVAAVVERCPELESLRLGKASPGLEGIRALAGRAAGLRLLDLSSNRLGPESMKLLAESPACDRLRMLDLSNNPIGTDGARTLAESPHLGELVELDVRGSGLSRAAILALEGRFGPGVRFDAAPRPVHKTTA